MENFKCTLTEKGIGIQGDAVNLNGEKYQAGFLLSYEEVSKNWDDAQKWCKEHGGALPSVEQLMIIAEHRSEINELLESAGKKTISGCYWSNKKYWNASGRALVVDMGSGNVFDVNTSCSGCVRAVSAFHFK